MGAGWGVSLSLRLASERDPTVRLTPWETEEGETCQGHPGDFPLGNGPSVLDESSLNNSPPTPGCLLEQNILAAECVRPTDVWIHICTLDTPNIPPILHRGLLQGLGPSQVALVVKKKMQET